MNGWVLTAVMAGALALAGCSKQEVRDDTAALEKSFSSADATLKGSADKAIAAIKSADYAGALAELKKLAEDAKLTPEQQQAVKDLTAKVQGAMGDAAGKAAEEAGKALKDVPTALPK